MNYWGLLLFICDQVKRNAYCGYLDQSVEVDELACGSLLLCLSTR
jgi:hypothetical protein